MHVYVRECLWVNIKGRSSTHLHSLIYSQYGNRLDSRTSCHCNTDLPKENIHTLGQSMPNLYRQ